MSNAYEERARAVKAYAIVDAILSCAEVLQETAPEDQLSAIVERASPEMRSTLAEMAGKPDPSDRTWDIVVDLLRHIEQARNE